MHRWRDAPADESEEDKHRVDVPINVLFTEWQVIESWLYSPAGYASVGGGRQMKSPRTAAILREDVAFSLSFMTAPALGGFCDPVIVTDVVKRIVMTYRSPTRMYNIISAMQKVMLIVTRNDAALNVCLCLTVTDGVLLPITEGNGSRLAPAPENLAVLVQ